MTFDNIKFSKDESGGAHLVFGAGCVKLDNAELLRLVNIVRSKSDNITHDITSPDKECLISVRKIDLLNKSILLFVLVFKSDFTVLSFLYDVDSIGLFILQLVSYLVPQTREESLLKSYMELFSYWTKEIEDMLDEMY